MYVSLQKGLSFKTTNNGDVIEVVGSTDSGLLEGVLRGRTGLLPRHLVQEVRFRSHANNKEVIKENDVSPRSVEMSPRSVEVSPRVGGRREGEIMKHFGTATKSGVTFVTGLPRQCVLHKGRKGFGFVLRGAKAASPLMDMIPSHKCPSLQYMDDVDPGGVADMGDFLLAINNEDVTTASHETVVNLIRKSGDLVQLNVLTVTAEYGAKNFSSTLPTPRGFSTLPRKPGGRTPLQHPPPPPRRDPATTLSVGRARAKSMVANLAAMDTLSAAIREKDPSLLSEAKSEDALNQMKADGGDGSTKLFARELELIFRRNSGLTAGVSKATKHGGADETLDTEIPDLEEVVMTRRSVSQENLNSLHHTPHTDLKDGSNHTGYYTLPSKGRRGQWAGKEDYLKEEEVYRTVTRIRPVQRRRGEPSPGTLSGTNPDYAKVSPVTGPASSFKPAVNARLYESPKGIPDVAYKSSVKSDDVGAKKRSPTRTHSLPPRPSKPLVLKRVEEPVGGVERYKVNGVNYTTYTTFRSPLTPDTDTRFDDEEDSSRTPTNELTPEEDQETTYSGYPGPEPPYQEYPGPGTPEPYPGVYPGGVPHIPEPDYDISDLENCENGSYSGSDSSWRQDQEQFRDTATLRRNQRNERKKKKTVSFIMNQDIANIIHSSGTMTKKDSILKDTKHHVDVGEEPGCWRPTRRSPTKSVPPPPTAKSTPPKSSLVKESMFATKKKPVVKGGVIPPHLEWEGGSLPAHPEWVEEPEYEVWQPAHPGNDQRSVEMTVQPTLTSNSKIRIEIGNQVQKPSTPTLAKSISFSNHLNPTNQANQTSPNHVKQTINHGKSSSPRTNSENNIDLKPRDHGSDSLINKSDIQKARSQLKSSRSLPDIVDEQDNSSSGVSSDQDIHQDSDFVTQLTVSPLSLPPVPAGKPWGRSTDRWPRTTDDDSQSSGTGSSHSDDLTDKTWILQSEKDLNGRNMNMMSSKEKEMKREGSYNGLSVQSISGHSAVHSGSTLPSQQYNANTLRKEPVEIEWSQENHYQNSAIKLEKSLPQLGDHVNVRRPFRSDDRMSRSFCQESSTLSRVESLMTSGRAQLKNGMSTSVLDRCRTIDESLALINHYVKDLNQPELYEGVPPPPSSATPSLSICPSPRSDESPPLLAPPPGFSDSDLSLTSDPGSEAGGGFQRFGASRVSRAINPAVSARERGTVDVKRINSDFRSRSLLEWSESDVCDWLDSLFIPEYKAAFRDSGVNGARLATLDNRDWERLGVVKIVHRLNILKSIKRYMPKK
ncbi:SH3 and multiple ankyrin repeat domains protein 3 [Eurytemora carolleeae]|uniref:SH3 and multiple ankyrin repeat domains protein 3 n=1 Tax=Eurytemora carolleeae TaxID=1294199 RepID=UPI000C758093|nr:SH3 and multiple ankyrin repeat domains protein 3 [Eurytemora carolleeae]|eukprot:XP_023341633.1 SH3 and multiple ankyrin repeat domains protein 3-like [Eurytemora affinis]